MGSTLLSSFSRTFGRSVKLCGLVRTCTVGIHGIISVAVVVGSSLASGETRVDEEDCATGATKASSDASAVEVAEMLGAIRRILIPNWGKR